MRRSALRAPDRRCPQAAKPLAAAILNPATDPKTLDVAGRVLVITCGTIREENNGPSQIRPRRHFDSNNPITVQTRE